LGRGILIGRAKNCIPLRERQKRVMEVKIHENALHEALPFKKKKQTKTATRSQKRIPAFFPLDRNAGVAKGLTSPSEKKKVFEWNKRSCLGTGCGPGCRIDYVWGQRTTGRIRTPAIR